MRRKAHGSKYKGRRTGTLGDAAAFSFYPASAWDFWRCGAVVRTMTTFRRSARTPKLRLPDKVFNDCKGLNSRLDELQAAILRVKLLI